MKYFFVVCLLFSLSVYGQDRFLHFTKDAIEIIPSYEVWVIDSLCVDDIILVYGNRTSSETKMLFAFKGTKGRNTFYEAIDEIGLTYMIGSLPLCFGVRLALHISPGTFKGITVRIRDSK